MSKQHLYTGKSGQLAVMAEFVSRGYNVAVLRPARYAARSSAALAQRSE